MKICANATSGVWRGIKPLDVVYRAFFDVATARWAMGAGAGPLRAHFSCWKGGLPSRIGCAFDALHLGCLRLGRDFDSRSRIVSVLHAVTMQPPRSWGPRKWPKRRSKIFSCPLLDRGQLRDNTGWGNPTPALWMTHWSPLPRPAGNCAEEFAGGGIQAVVQAGQGL